MHFCLNFSKISALRAKNTIVGLWTLTIQYNIILLSMKVSHPPIQKLNYLGQKVNIYKYYFKKCEKSTSFSAFVNEVTELHSKHGEERKRNNRNRNSSNRNNAATWSVGLGLVGLILS